MPIASRISLPHLGFLAASAMVLTTVLPANPGLARGSGGGHASMEHAAPQAMPHSGGAIGTPAHGEPSRPSGTPAGGHAANDYAHHRDHHRTRGSEQTTPTTDTTTDLTTLPDTSSSTATTTNATAPSTGSSAQQTSPSTPSNTNTGPEVVETTGGTLAPDTHPGGGGDTFAACMSFWKPDAHMTKGEWRDTCVRTLNGLDAGGGVTDNLAKTAAPHHARTAHHRTR